MSFKKILVFCFISFLLIVPTQVYSVDNDLAYRTVRVSGNSMTPATETSPLPYIPASEPIITGLRLEKPVEVVIDLQGHKENGEILKRCDAFLRMLSGNQNIEVKGIYGIEADKLAQYLRSNVAHNNWRGMELTTDDNYIEFNGVRIPVSNSGKINKPREKGIGTIVDFKNVVAPEKNGIYLALKTLADSDLNITNVAAVDIIDNEGASDITLEGNRPTLDTVFEGRFNGEFSKKLEKAILDYTHSGVENGGSAITLEVQVGPNVTKEDINALFRKASESSDGTIAFAEPNDVIASGYFIDVDSGHKFVGPSFVYSSRDTSVKNGVAVINGWTSDYATAQSMINELEKMGEKKYGLKEQKDETTSASPQNSIPPVVREDAKSKRLTEPVRTAIYGGGGRIGTAALTSMIGDPNFNPVVIGGIRNVEEFVNMLRQDTARGHVYADIKAIREDGKQYISINGKKIRSLGRADTLSDLPWDEYNVDFAIDATGHFRTRAQLEQHMEAGAGSVGLTVSPSDAKQGIPQLVPGVNGGTMLKLSNGEVISFATCTTNNITTALSVMQRFLSKKGIEAPKAVTIKTVHAYTKSQNPLDGQITKPTDNLDKVTKKAERGVASPANVLITTTGSAKAAPQVMSAWPADIYSSAVAARVGNIDGSVTTARIYLKENADFTTEDVKNAFKEASQGYLKNILQYHESDTPLDSRAILMNDHTSIVESSHVSVHDNVIEFRTWYDNEWGYTQQVMRAMVMYRLALKNPNLSTDQLLKFSNRLDNK